ncbi:hypothetical protein BGP81_28120 [Pseudomonas putida]|nr:hypothetical protein BGP81_28120 [Pseudomonas putida]
MALYISCAVQGSIGQFQHLGQCGGIHDVSIPQRIGLVQQLTMMGCWGFVQSCLVLEELMPFQGRSQMLSCHEKGLT